MARTFRSIFARLRRASPETPPPGPESDDTDPFPDDGGSPDGVLVWVADSGPGAAAAVAELARVAQELRDDLAFLFTSRRAPVPDGPCRRAPAPGDTASAVRRFFDRRTPAIALFFTSDLPATAFAEALHRGVPVVVICDIPPPRSARALLRRAAMVFAIGEAQATALRRLGQPESRLEVCGPLSEGNAPPDCSHAERERIARLLAGRPVWLACETTEGEDAIMIEAQAEAARLAHRLLLILIPDLPARGAGLAADLRGRGWRVALRSEDGVPDEETQVFIADLDAELGLWLRLAPVTLLGGSLLSEGPDAADPFGPAALGSAIVHGPRDGTHAAALARLGAAGATRPVHDAASLARALNTLSAPHRAAELAQKAWQVITEGAVSTELVATRLLAELDTSERR